MEENRTNSEADITESHNEIVDLCTSVSGNIKKSEEVTSSDEITGIDSSSTDVIKALIGFKELLLAQTQSINENIVVLNGKQEQNNTQLTDINRKYHNEFARVIDNQQKELEGYRFGLEKKLIEPVLTALAHIYRDYDYLLEQDMGSVQNNGNIRKMFESICDVLIENGVEEQRSINGEKYSKRFSKVIEKEPTHNKELHNSVIESKRVGFRLGQSVLTPEYVKVYVFEETSENNPVIKID